MGKFKPTKQMQFIIILHLPQKIVSTYLYVLTVNYKYEITYKRVIYKYPLKNAYLHIGELRAPLTCSIVASWIKVPSVLSITTY